MPLTTHTKVDPRHRNRFSIEYITKKPSGIAYTRHHVEWRDDLDEAIDTACTLDEAEHVEAVLKIEDRETGTVLRP